MAGLISTQQASAHAKEAYKRGLTLYTIAPELKLVKRRKPAPPPDELAEVKALFKQNDKEPDPPKEPAAPWKSAADEHEAELEAERKAKALDVQLMRGNDYAGLKQRLQASRGAFITALRRGDGEAQEQAEREFEAVRAELKAYLEAHDVPPDMVEALTK